MTSAQSTLDRWCRAILLATLSLVAWGALALQLGLTLKQAHATGTSLAGAFAGYLSYFTILTNLLVALAAFVPLVASASRPATFLQRPSVITGICVCIVAGSIAYNLLLRHIWAPQGLQRLADEMLHVATGVLFAAYWWLAVPRGSINWSDLPSWLLYPLVYFVYMLLRGMSVGRYPYPFLDAAALGYGQVVTNAAAILAAVAVVGGALVLIKRERRVAL